MHERSYVIEAATPAEGFSLLDGLLPSAEQLSLRTKVQRRAQGDLLVLDFEYIDPEGKQVDVDFFLPSREVYEVELDFGIELEEAPA